MICDESWRSPMRLSNRISDFVADSVRGKLKVEYRHVGNEAVRTAELRVIVGLDSARARGFQLRIRCCNQQRTTSIVSGLADDRSSQPENAPHGSFLGQTLGSIDCLFFALLYEKVSRAVSRYRYNSCYNPLLDLKRDLT